MSASLLIGIVDDDPAVRGSLDSLLRSVGMIPCCFAAAEELLAFPGLEALACIVTDLHMPGMSGLQLADEIARQRDPKPVILVTAYPTAAARDQAARAGVRAFLTKPVDPDLLLEAVDEAIQPL